MHPLYHAPVHLLTFLRDAIIAGVPLDSILNFITNQWRPGFTEKDILEWAAVEAIQHGSALREAATSASAQATTREGASSTSAHDSASPQPPPRRRVGKIARLPKEVRDELNARIEDGAPYEQIIQWLNESGHPGINEQNVSAWKNGGYEDWLREAERLDLQSTQRQWLAEKFEQSDPNQMLPLVNQLYVSQMMDTLFGLDTAALKQGLANKPRDIVALMNSLNRLQRQMPISIVPTPANQATQPSEGLSGAEQPSPESIKPIKPNQGY